MRTLIIFTALTTLSTTLPLAYADESRTSKESAEVRSYIDALKKLSDEDLIRKGETMATKLQVTLRESVERQRLDSRINAEATALAQHEQLLATTRASLDEHLQALAKQRQRLRESIDDLTEADRKFKILAMTKLDYLSGLRTRVATLENTTKQLGGRLASDRLKRKLFDLKIEMQSEIPATGSQRPLIIPEQMLGTEDKASVATSKAQDRQFDLLMKTLDEMKPNPEKE